MKMVSLRPEYVEAYDRYLLKHPESLFSYSSKYKDFLRDLLGCQENYLLCLEGGQVCGILPLLYANGQGGRVYNSIPYYGSNGGIIADGPAAYQALVDGYNEIAGSEMTIASTVVGNPFARQDASRLRFNYTDYRIGQFTCLAAEDDPWGEILARVESSARRNVKKAVREGVTVEIDQSQLDRLRQMHQANIRAINGIPKNDRFFELVPRYFTPGRDYDLYVARRDGVVIAGLLLFYFNQTVEYFTPAIDSEYRSIQPLSLIVITAMSDAARRGFKWWNWGGTWASQTGVYRFKKKWAAREQKYFYYTQLNDLSILDWPSEKILKAYPNFYVVPFSALNNR